MNTLVKERIELKEKIAENKKRISSTEYKMSVGEIIHLYKEGEIIIDPNFQRLFRWKDEQKTKLIESILVNIPIPPIFIQQREDSSWEVIDGVQRLSTILEFVGALKDKNKSTLGTSDLLPLDGETYDDFDKNLQLDFKRFALSLVILLKESDQDTKYELFDRLNSGGSLIADQEIRQAIYRDRQEGILNLIDKLAENEKFKELISISERRLNEAYDRELVLRFFAYSDNPDLSDYGNSIKKLLDNYLLHNLKKEKLEEYEEKFLDFINFLYELKEERIFHRRNGFSIAKYEVIVIGYIHTKKLSKEKFKKKIKEFEEQDWFKRSINQASFASKRLPIYEENAPNFFNEE